MLATRVGRNEPCPCGSGRKYKKCHLGSEDQDRGRAASAAALHRLDHLVSHDLLAFARKRFGAGWMEEATSAWGGLPEDPQLFGPWLLYHYRGLAGMTAVAAYLTRGGRVDARERAFLEAQSRTWISVWEIIDVRRGTGLAVRDLLTGEERTLHERKGSESLVARDAVLGRVLDHDGVSVFCGIHHRPLGPREAAAVVAEFRRVERPADGRMFRTEELRSEETTLLLLTAWEEVVAEVDARPLPMINNTDGDPLLLTEDRFELDAADRRRVIECLASIAGAQTEEDGAEIHVSFTRPGNKMHKTWENTIVGHAEVRADGIVVSTNSTRRANAVRKSIEKACGSLVRHRVRQHSDPETAMREKPPARRRNEAEDDGIPAAEKLRIIREFQEKHYRGWLDQKIPALSGKTPRAAAREPRGRKALDLLLREIEHGEARRPEAERFDVGILRRELGLEESVDVAPPQPGSTWPAALPEPEGPVSFDGAYLIDAGLAGSGRKARHVVVAARPGGKTLAAPPQDGATAAKAVAAVFRNLPAGMAVQCEPSLAKAIGRAKIEPGPLPRDLAATKAALALSLAAVAPEDISPELLEAFVLRATNLYRAEPWRHWNPTQLLRAAIRVGSGTTSHALEILGGAGADPGFVIRDPGVDSGTAMTGLAMSFGEDPPFLADAFRTAFGIPLGPIPLRARAGEPVLIETVDVAVLCAAADAIARLTPSTRTARGEFVVDGSLRVVVDVTAPAA